MIVGLDSQESGRKDLNGVANIGSIEATSLDLDSLSVENFEEAVCGFVKVDYALAKVSSFRGSIGETQNRFRRALNTINISVGNLTAASANIKNQNVAEEITELTKQQFPVQSSAAIVDQANLIPSGVSLLRQQ
jgi:flagellin